MCSRGDGYLLWGLTLRPGVERFSVYNAVRTSLAAFFVLSLFQNGIDQFAKGVRGGIPGYG